MRAARWGLLGEAGQRIDPNKMALLKQEHRNIGAR
jgi:hypothetical protein